MMTNLNTTTVFKYYKGKNDYVQDFIHDEKMKINEKMVRMIKK